MGSGTCMKYLNFSILKFLYKGMMLGDGNNRGNCYYTSSDSLLSGFSKLCFHLGYGFTLRLNSSTDNNFNNDKIYKRGYVISIRKKNPGSFLRDSLKENLEINDVKMVCCIEVKDNHSFFGGRKGKFQWIGNCSYLGIPCVGYEYLDTQRLLHPFLTVSESNLSKAVDLIERLKQGTAFYVNCVQETKDRYQTYYGEKVFLEKFERIVNKEL